MKILIIGANGQLGTEFFKLENNHELIPLTLKELDITDHYKANELITEYRPDAVINLAALTNLNLCEEDPELCFRVNAFAELNLAKVTERIGAKILFVSSDYVFGHDKLRDKPLVESDARGAVNVYGESKIAGEDFTIFTNPKHFVVRSSVLFGAKGAEGKGGNIVETMIKLGKERDEVGAVVDQTVSPTYTKELANNILKLVETEGFGTYHMTGQGSCTFYEFTEEIYKLMNIDTKINKVSVDDFDANHKKPKYTVLENKALKEINLDLMSDWKVMLSDYLKEKEYIN